MKNISKIQFTWETSKPPPPLNIPSRTITGGENTSGADQTHTNNHTTHDIHIRMRENKERNKQAQVSVYTEKLVQDVTHTHKHTHTWSKTPKLLIDL